MGNIKFQVNQIHRNLIDSFIILKLKLNYSLGRYDNNTESLLNYFSRRWYLSKLSESVFLNFLNEQIKITERRNNSNNHRFYNSVSNIFLAYAPSTLIIFLMLIIPFPVTRELLLITLTFTLILAYILTIIIIERKPTERKLNETERYLKILKSYSLKKWPMAILKTTNVINDYKTIKLPFTNSEISAFIYFLKNNKNTDGITVSHLTYFIETKCIKDDGNAYNSLDSLKCRCNPENGEFDAELLLKSFFNKLQQIKRD